jgi:L-tryptophan--pyruvate aminotransferase
MTRETINLKVGEPSFYQEYWANNSVSEIVSSDSIYDYPIVNNKLIQSIINLHESIHGFRLVPDNIVIGNGASQLISASMYAKKLIHLKVKVPYWPRIPELCIMGGYKQNLLISQDSWNHFLISPNNPDGAVAPLEEILSASTVDSCYNWPQYVSFGIVNSVLPDISLYSLSKAMGLAGLRLGWAITKNPLLAEEMRHYVEYSTAGVSVDTQSKASNYISYAESKLVDGEDVFSWASGELQYRWSKVMDAFDGTAIIPMNNGKGMFIWLHAPSLSDLPLHLEEYYGIISMSGSDCGVNNHYARLNLACHAKEFDKFIKRVENAKIITSNKP